MKKILFACCVVMEIYALHPVMAGEMDRDLSLAELRVLPGYCQVKWKYGENRNAPEVQKWVSILGEDYVHIHHYCLGLNFVNRANRSFGNQSDTTYLLRKAEGNLIYVVKHTKESLVLLPEVYVQLGKVYVRQGKGGEAGAQFQKAIKLRDDYSPGYAALSDMYKGNNNRAEALRVVEEGLKHAPDSKSLKRRLQELSK